jgi:hypothetical protein
MDCGDHGSVTSARSIRYTGEAALRKGCMDVKVGLCSLAVICHQKCETGEKVRGGQVLPEVSFIIVSN